MSIAPIEVPASARYEVKFAAREQELDRVLHWLRLHPAAFAERYAPRRVNNVYFDTHDYAAFAEKLAGVSERSKLRYRWYGGAALPDVGVLERKCRRNVFGWKQAFEVAAAPRASTWPEFAGALRDAVPAAARHLLAEHPVVVMINRYDRRYFESADGRVRATVDTGLVALDQRLDPRPNVDRAAPLTPRVVLELKFARDDRDLAAEHMRDVPFRVSAHSKYALAVVALSGR